MRRSGESRRSLRPELHRPQFPRVPGAERGDRADQDASEQPGRPNERPAELPSVHRPHGERRAGVVPGDRAGRASFFRPGLLLPRTP